MNIIERPNMFLSWSGRSIRSDKRGAIDQLPSILHRLSIDEDYWCEAMKPKANRYFSRAIRCQTNLWDYAKKLEIAWMKVIGMCGKLFLA